MGLFSFIKEAGEKLFGGKPAQAATAAAPSAEALNTQAAQAITTYIQAQNLGLEDLQVTFDGSEGKVTVRGAAPTQAAKEKVTLCCGNVASVQSVDNEMTVTRRYVLLSFCMNKLLCWNFFYFKRESLCLNKRWGDLQIKALL